MGDEPLSSAGYTSHGALLWNKVFNCFAKHCRSDIIAKSDGVFHFEAHIEAPCLLDRRQRSSRQGHWEQLTRRAAGSQSQRSQNIPQPLSSYYVWRQWPIVYPLKTPADRLISSLTDMGGKCTWCSTLGFLFTSSPSCLKIQVLILSSWHRRLSA